MKRPWMPLYVADYRADTGHLRTVEHGAYFLLIMYYWSTGGLPNDDADLARIAGMSSAEWKKARPRLAPFFTDGWKHKRIDAEIELAQKKYEARAKAGQSGGKAKANRKQTPSNAKANGYQPQPHSVPNGTGVPPPDPKKELFQRGREVFGESGGGLTAKLLRSIGSEDDPKVIAKARARIEEASTKAKPVEWLGRVMSSRQPAVAVTSDGRSYPEGII